MSSVLLGGPWPRYPLVYEINTRVWLAELSTRQGRALTLDQVPPDEIERIARLGFHAVWLMGVWTTGSEPAEIASNHPELQKEYRAALPDYSPADVIGSPYAVSAYRVPPQLGGPEALAALRGKLARQGLRLMLDFAANHTARDHRWVREHPEFYIQGSADDLAREPHNYFKTLEGRIIAHGRDPYFPGWTDTAQLNCAQRTGREAIKEELRAVVAQCDGVRCDMAMLCLPEIMERVWSGRLGADPLRDSFWREAIAELQPRHPNCLLLAESYWDTEWRLQQEGFHFTYDKKLYDRLRQDDFGGVRRHLDADPAFMGRSARFIENHDEPRAISAFGAAGARSAAAASFFAPGLRLFHEGQLEGFRIKTPVQLGRRAQESEDVETALFYERILDVLQDPIFQNGAFQQREVKSAGWGDASNESLLALSWTPPESRNARNALGFLVVVNLSGARAYARIPLPAESFSAGMKYIFYDRYEGKRYERDGDELLWPGLYVALEGHQPHIFEMARQ